MKRTSTPDKLEEEFALLCSSSGIKFVRPAGRIDFYLPEIDLHVELKQWPCDRLSGQLESMNAGPEHSAMVLIGAGAVEGLRRLSIALRKGTGRS